EVADVFAFGVLRDRGGEAVDGRLVEQRVPGDDRELDDRELAAAAERVSFGAGRELLDLVGAGDEGGVVAEPFAEGRVGASGGGTDDPDGEVTGGAADALR